MRDVGNDTPTLETLQKNWESFWDFIQLLQHIPSHFAYLDLRPDLNNLRFYNGNFVLLDYDSIGTINLNIDDGRYPETENASVYMLGQALAAVWATTYSKSEPELKANLWNHTDSDNFKRFKEFCGPNLKDVLDVCTGDGDDPGDIQSKIRIARQELREKVKLVKPQQ